MHVLRHAERSGYEALTGDTPKLQNGWILVSTTWFGILSQLMSPLAFQGVWASGFESLTALVVHYVIGY